MRRPRPTLGHVFETLAEEKLFGSDWAVRILAEADLRPSQPWYVRAMVGWGAWLGSLLLIAAIVGLSLAATGGGYIVLGAVLILVSLAASRISKRNFTRHAAIATSLAGQGLLAWGMADLSLFGISDDIFLTLILTNVLLLRGFRDKIHRYLSVLLIVGSVVGLVYAYEFQAMLPFLGPLLAWGVVALMKAEASLVSQGRDEALIPVMAGMLMSAFGCLMISTFYVLPEVAGTFTFYPRPWISTLLLGVLLLYVQRGIWAEMFGDPASGAAMAAYGMTAVVILAALPAPGIILGLLVMALGLVHGNRLYAGMGAAFLPVFIGTYFYGIDLSMLTKSVTLVGTGLVILFARHVLIAHMDRSRKGAYA